MAFRETPVTDIEYVAEVLDSAAKRLSSLARAMRVEHRKSIYTQLESVKNHYISTIDKLASDIERHYKDQKRCEESGDEPEWQRTQRKSADNKARKEAKRVRKQERS